jgi:hypothetical protein
MEKKKYLTKITPIQEKFIEIYCAKYGEWSATQCAIARWTLNSCCEYCK